MEMEYAGIAFKEFRDHERGYVLADVQVPIEHCADGNYDRRRWLAFHHLAVPSEPRKVAPATGLKLVILIMPVLSCKD